MDKITESQSQETEGCWLDEQQISEAVHIANQARLLNLLAQIAISDASAAYAELNDSKILCPLHPDLKFLEYCLINMIGHGLYSTDPSFRAADILNRRAALYVVESPNLEEK